MCDDPLFYATGNDRESMIWLDQYKAVVKVKYDESHRDIWLEFPEHAPRPYYLTKLQASFLSAALKKHECNPSNLS